MQRCLWLLCFFLSACSLGGFNTGGIEQVDGQFSENPEEAERVFMEVASKVQPVATEECRKAREDGLCKFKIVVNLNRRAPPNAFQTQSENGQPVLSFTVSMIASISNADELAFVMAHEAAHHILNHLRQQKLDAMAGAEAFGQRVAEAGGTKEDIRRAQQMGAQVGARVYSKNYELEADELGTLITLKAGYDPRRGALYFERLPEPDDDFLGSHPPNNQRQDLVNKTAQRLGY